MISTIANPPFMQNSHLSQQSLVSNPIPIAQNMGTQNPPMGMLSGGPPAPNQRYPMQGNPMQQQIAPQQQQQRQQILMRQPNPSLGPPSNTPSAPHMQSQLQGMPFPGGMMPQTQGANSVRRVVAQSHINVGSMPPNAANIPMGMNPQASMPAHLRQQHNSLRMQQLQGGMSSDMNMAINRQPQNSSLPQNLARSGSGQAVMNSLAHGSPMGPVAQTNASQPLANPFPSGGPIPSQQPSLQVSSSPRPGSMPPSHTPTTSMSTPGPSNTPVNRARMTPDSNIAFTYPGSQFPGNNNNRMLPSATPGPYAFVPSSTPPMPMADITQTSPPSLMHSQGGTPGRLGFMQTPQGSNYEMMGDNMYGTNFAMAPPSAPPRPPSQQRNPNHPAPQPQQQPPNPAHQPTQQPQQQQQQQQQQQPSHQSPPQSAQMNPQPRPQSQPQAAPGRPPSQSGASQTPRLSQAQAPPSVSGHPGGLTAIGRLPNALPGPVSGPPVNHLPIAPRPPPSMSIPGGPPMTAMPSTPIGPPSLEAGPSTGITMQRPMAPGGPPGLGTGQGVLRLLQFSGVLSTENKGQRLQLSWWTDVIQKYFTPKAIMKLTLWKDNQRNEAKPFEIGIPILPRFFLVTTQSGVKSMTFSLDGARERNLNPGHCIVECVSAVWTYRYTNGYTVTLKGPLTTHVIVTTTHAGNAQVPQFALKFDDFQFDANYHDKYIALESIMGLRNFESPNLRSTPGPSGPQALGQQQQQQLQQIEEDKKWEEPRVSIEHASIPGEPVNAFGIPQATMRCLELAESVSSMAELISFSNAQGLGPKDALKDLAAKIRGAQLLQAPFNQGQPSMMNGIMSNSTSTSLSHSFPPYLPPSAVTVASGTLYSPAPTSVTNPQPPPSSHTASSHTASTMNSPQNTNPSASNSPDKQPKSIPPQNPSQPSAPTSSPATSSGGTTNTPSMSNASLKRKQAGDATSPTMANPDQPPTKRVPRKRGRTGTAGAG